MMSSPDVKMQVVFSRVGKDRFRFVVKAIKADGTVEILSHNWSEDSVAVLKVGDEIAIEVGPNG